MDLKQEFKRLIEIVKFEEKRNNRPCRQEDIADAVGIARTYLSSLLKDSGDPVGAKNIKLLKATYPYLSENNTNEINQVNEPGTYLDKRRKIKNENNKPAVPMYGGFTTLGNIEVYDDEKLKHKVIAYLPTEIFPGCDYSERAKGQSMYPIIMNQAVLAGRTCGMDGIVFGEIYTIKTKKGLDTTKYVHPGSQDGYIKLVAYNKQVPEQEVKMDDVVFAYRVYFIINPI